MVPTKAEFLAAIARQRERQHNLEVALKHGDVAFARALITGRSEADADAKIIAAYLGRAGDGSSSR